MSITLGPGPVVIPLTQWAEDSISAIYNATTESNFNDAFDAFLLKDAKITVNGKHLSVAQYKQKLVDQKILEQSAQVSYKGAVSVPKNPNEPAQAGSVGLFFTALIVEKLREFGAPVTRTVTSSVNLTIVEDGGVEDRKVSALTQIITVEANPVEPPHAVPTGATASK